MIGTLVAGAAAGAGLVRLLRWPALIACGGRLVPPCGCRACRRGLARAHLRLRLHPGLACLNFWPIALLPGSRRVAALLQEVYPAVAAVCGGLPDGYPIFATALPPGRVAGLACTLHADRLAAENPSFVGVVSLDRLDRNTAAHELVHVLHSVRDAGTAYAAAGERVAVAVAHHLYGPMDSASGRTAAAQAWLDVVGPAEALRSALATLGCTPTSQPCDAACPTPS
jgi:hypothetical protein